jgi:hypothetical protein
VHFTDPLRVLGQRSRWVCGQEEQRPVRGKRRDGWIPFHMELLFTPGVVNENPIDRQPRPAAELTLGRWEYYPLTNHHLQAALVDLREPAYPQQLRGANHAVTRVPERYQAMRAFCGSRTLWRPIYQPLNCIAWMSCGLSCIFSWGAGAMGVVTAADGAPILLAGHAIDKRGVPVPTQEARTSIRVPSKRRGHFFLIQWSVSPSTPNRPDLVCLSPEEHVSESSPSRAPRTSAAV